MGQDYIMLYGRKKTSLPAGFYHMQSDGEFVRLRDESGETWQGTVEAQTEDMVRYRFRDRKGRSLSGVSDGNGILLRDERGNTWRGFVS
jgi:hypothetical protein